MTAPLRADLRAIERHIDVLCRKIGERYSGTKAEQRAADYVAEQFHAIRLAGVHQHLFEFPNWNYSSHSLTITRNGKTRRVPSTMPMCYSPSTPKRGVRGEVAYLQSGTPLDFRQNLRGKIGLVIGSLGLSKPETMAMLRRSGIVGLLSVDSRIPFAWRAFLGAAPQWMEGYDIPTIGVPFLEAERIVREMPSRVEMHVGAKTFPAMSQNVIGEIVGSEKPDEVIVVSGHHDTVLGMVGADDNGSGVVATLELARMFAKRKPKRTMRFISYGVEEKLSVGAYLYMRSLSPREQRRIAFVLNIDTIASTVGTDVVFVTGSPGHEQVARDVWAKRRHPAEVRRDVVPYSDHFPLNICGVPSIWLGRPSIMTEGYWYLHSVHDNPLHISAKVMARTIESAAALLDRAANEPRLPFPRAIAPPVMKRVRAVATQAYRHPWDATKYRYPKSHR